MCRVGTLLVSCFVCSLALNVGCQSTPAFQIPPTTNNSELNGDYAFIFAGMTTGGGGASTPFAAVGRFTADGGGNLINGELDSNGFGVQEKLMAQPFTGSYQIGADHRGVITLNIPGGGSLAFVMMSNGNAKFVEVDASGSKGTVGSGAIEKADTTAYATSEIIGDYALGVAGFDPSNNRAAITGHLAASGSGLFGDGVLDVNQAGTFTTLNAFAATYTITDTTSGRGVIALPPVLGGVPQNLNFVFYTVNAGKLLAMETDVLVAVTPLLTGSIVRQQAPLGGFNITSLNGQVVTYFTGRASSGCGNGVAPAPNVIVGLLSANGSGALRLSYDQNCGGVTQSAAGLVGSYSVAANGRAAIHVGTNYLVAYLLSPNQVFLLAPDSSVLFGFGDPQEAVSFSSSSLQGAYAGSTTAAATLGVGIFSGEFTADGTTPTGNITGTEDIGAPSGPTLGSAVSAAYSIAPSPINGRGSIRGGIAGSGILYAVSGSKFVVVSLSDPNPTVLVFEQ